MKATKNTNELPEITTSGIKIKAEEIEYAIKKEGIDLKSYKTANVVQNEDGSIEVYLTPIN